MVSGLPFVIICDTIVKISVQCCSSIIMVISCILVQVVLPFKEWHKDLISCNFCSGIEMVLDSVFMRIPRHTTEVLGGTNFS